MQETESHKVKAKISKLFPNGGSMAVRLPKSFTKDTKEVYIIPQDDGIFLRPKRSKKAYKSWDDFFKNAPLLDEDIHFERDRSPPRPVPDLF